MLLLRFLFFPLSILHRTTKTKQLFFASPVSHSPQHTWYAGEEGITRRYFSCHIGNSSSHRFFFFFSMMIMMTNRNFSISLFLLFLPPFPFSIPQYTHSPPPPPSFCSSISGICATCKDGNETAFITPLNDSNFRQMRPQTWNLLALDLIVKLFFKKKYAYFSGHACR